MTLDEAGPPIPHARAGTYSKPGPSSNPALCAARCGRFRKLNPLHPRNPVMFTVVDLQRLRHDLFIQALAATARAARFHPRHLALAVVHRALRQLRRGDGGGPRQGSGRPPPPSKRDVKAKRCSGRTAGRPGGPALGTCATAIIVLMRSRRAHPRRRRSHRGHRLRRRIAPSPAKARRSSANPAATGRAVTGGTRVLSDWLVVSVTSNPGETFLDRMIAMVEGAKRQKTPNEIALDILLAGADDRLPAGHRHPAALLHLLRQGGRRPP